MLLKEFKGLFEIEKLLKARFVLVRLFVRSFPSFFSPSPVFSGALKGHCLAFFSTGTAGPWSVGRSAAAADGWGPVGRSCAVVADAFFPALPVRPAMEKPPRSRRCYNSSNGML